MLVKGALESVSYQHLLHKRDSMITMRQPQNRMQIKDSGNTEITIQPTTFSDREAAGLQINFNQVRGVTYRNNTLLQLRGRFIVHKLKEFLCPLTNSLTHFYLRLLYNPYSSLGFNQSVNESNNQSRWPAHVLSINQSINRMINESFTNIFIQI